MSIRSNEFARATWGYHLGQVTGIRKWDLVPRLVDRGIFIVTCRCGSHSGSSSVPLCWETESVGFVSVD